MFLIFTAITYLGRESKFFVETMGMLSSGIEALLGVPQFWLNFGRKNTFGLSLILILMWLVGDVYKMSYYQTTAAPVQLLMCACFQVTVDVSIISQFWLYRKETARLRKEAKRAAR